MSDTQTATVPAAEFLRVATNIALFTDTDTTRPTLCAVRFRSSWDNPAQLMVEATNRYVLAQEKLDLADLDHYHSTDQTGHDGHECPVPSTELDVIIGTKDLSSLVKTIKMQLDDSAKYGMPGDRPHVRITRAEGADRAEFTLVQNAGNEVTVKPRIVLGDFPKTEVLFDAAARSLDDGDQPQLNYLFNPAYLQLFTKVTASTDPRENKTALLEFHLVKPDKPVLFTIGDSFRGLIVPMRKATS